MKMTSLSLAMAGLLGAGAAQAAFLAPNSTYTATVGGISCFTFGNCLADGGSAATGSFTLTTDASGSNFSVGGYALDPYLGTPGGVFTTGGPVNGTGAVDGAGSMDLNFAGRTGSAQFFPTLGPAWNIDADTGAYEGFTTGADSNLDPVTGAINLTLTGTSLSLTGTSAGIGSWTGLLVSVGNVGTQWDFFAGTPYTEVYEISLQGPTPSAIPVPAAVWLMGSGLVGLVGLARRRRSA